MILYLPELQQLCLSFSGMLNSKALASEKFDSQIPNQKVFLQAWCNNDNIKSIKTKNMHFNAIL
jgi:hypothetical protein